jgi:regulator of protease activity HflC (stomatin/prohibitin superfamily)
MTNLTILLVIAALVALMFWANARQVNLIYPPNVGLLYRNGKFERELGPGRYVFYDLLKRTRVVKVSCAPLPVALGEVTVLSKDQFSFRVGVSPVVEVIDARAFIESQGAVEPTGFSQFMPHLASHAALHSLAASASFEVIAGYTLREIFADSGLVPNGVQAKLAAAIPGAAISRVLVTSITLPPETRKMFTEVERSKLEAEASLERARGEQASLRVLANAARLIKDNPALANLRFLQMLEQARGAKTIVVGSGGVPLVGDVSGAAGKA